jgi:hypothetical protein
VWIEGQNCRREPALMGLGDSFTEHRHMATMYAVEIANNEDRTSLSNAQIVGCRVIAKYREGRRSGCHGALGSTMMGTDSVGRSFD